VARGVGGSRGDKRRLGDSQDTLLRLATGDQARLRRAAVTLLAVSGVEPAGQKGNRAEGQRDDRGSATERALARAVTRASNASAAPDARIDAIALLALADAAAYQRVFESAVTSAEADAVQIAGVNALGRLPGGGAAAFLLARWPTLTTPVRSAAATVILSRREGAQAMLDALQSGAVKPWMLNFWQKRSLIMHRDEHIRAVGRTILEESPDARAKTVARYAAALEARGSAARGADVFTRNCSMCHQIDGKGGMAMGPDLSTVRHRPMPLLLADILEPSRSIAQHYETYQVTRAAGDPLVGVISDQSPTAITFRQGPGQSVTVMRRDIRQMSVSPQSTMPEGLHEQVTPTEMADLLAYLTQSSAGTPHPLPEAGSGSASSIAAALLDDRHDQKVREALARDVAARAPEIVGALVSDLPNDEGEEYRRIPWIWRVAVAAGRSKDESVLRALLDASMPNANQPLRDWQAVVLGGGVVMGLSQAGAWPKDVMTPWLASDAARAARWARSLDLAMVMADNPKVRNGTRYDALRMLATLPWERVSAQLLRCLAPNVDAELQAGAIGGLSDLQDARVADALVQHASQLAAENRRHAINALLRTAERRARLRQALAAGAVEDAWLTSEQREKLAIR
jgi:putative heme-binding domain-containing protein